MLLCSQGFSLILSCCYAFSVNEENERYLNERRDKMSVSKSKSGSEEICETRSAQSNVLVE